MGNPLANQGFGVMVGGFHGRLLGEVAGLALQTERGTELSLKPWIARAQLMWTAPIYLMK
ncbi:MAG TPA: hypothetical protein VLK65_15375 [Vicinamibacteria bacterium]|nr:hypothetical protein [Vicinamibacteria bacterium]